MNVVREITPLTQSDCFTIFSKYNPEFDLPLHNHEEIELNLILNAAGAKRSVGDHSGIIEDFELVMAGSNLSHRWARHHCSSNDTREITIQFHKDLLDERLLKKNELSGIRKLLDNIKKGVLFSQQTAREITPRIIELSKNNGFSAILELFSIIHTLADAPDKQLLSSADTNLEKLNSNSRRIEKVFEYMNLNFSKQLTLTEASKIANMPEASFSRFIKTRTGYTFTDSLTEIRLAHVIRMLIDTPYSVAEIAFKCGFNNMANFNRIFKSKKGCTPKEFRADYNGNMIFV